MQQHEFSAAASFFVLYTANAKLTELIVWPM